MSTFQACIASPRRDELKLLAILLMPTVLVSHCKERPQSLTLPDVLILEMLGMKGSFEVCQAWMVHGAETEAKTSDHKTDRRKGDGKEMSMISFARRE